MSNTTWKPNLECGLKPICPKSFGWPEGWTGNMRGATLFLCPGGCSALCNRRSPRHQGAVPQARFAKLPGAALALHAESAPTFEPLCGPFLTRFVKGNRRCAAYAAVPATRVVCLKKHARPIPIMPPCSSCPKAYNAGEFARHRGPEHAKKNDIPVDS